ncbi:MAG: nitroreductase family protein [Anaerolineae bacterium]
MSHKSSRYPLNIVETIETRRSIRKFVQEPMDQDDLHTILRLTSLAPSSANVQPWRFVIIQDKELQEKLRAVAFDQQQITNAPVVIALYSDMEDVLAHAEETVHPGMGEEAIKERAETMRQRFGKMTIEQRASWANAQANIALGFLLLAAHGIGYGTSPMLGFMPDKVKELLNLPPYVEMAALVALGRPDEEGFSHHRHAPHRITHAHHRSNGSAKQ